MRRGWIRVAALAAAAVLAWPASTAPAHATYNVVVAQPRSAADNYVTRDVTVVHLTPGYFLNADPLAPHNVVARDGSFTSGDPVGPGVYRIVGLEDTAPGIYEFFCTFHAGTMFGTLTIVIP